MSTTPDSGYISLPTGEIESRSVTQKCITLIAALAVIQGHHRSKKESDLLNEQGMRGKVQQASQGRSSANESTVICLTGMMWHHVANGFIHKRASHKVPALHFGMRMKCSHHVIDHDIK